MTVATTPTPRIVIKAVSLVAVLVERDDCVERLCVGGTWPGGRGLSSGEDVRLSRKRRYKTAAMAKMIKVASTFFQ